jgi:hypothetical protein
MYSGARKIKITVVITGPEKFQATSFNERDDKNERSDKRTRELNDNIQFLSDLD